MITGDARFARRLRRRVREEQRRLPKHRRGKSPRGRQYSWGALRWLLPAGVFFLPLAAEREDHLLALMALHTTLALLRRVGELANVLHSPGELWVPCFFPFENRVIFDEQTRRWRRSLFVLVADWIAFAAGMAVFRAQPWMVWLALPLAAAQTTVVAWIAVRAARRGGHPAWIFGSLLLHAGAFGAFVFGNKIAAFGRWLSEDATPLMLHATPAGLLAKLAHATPREPWSASGCALLLAAGAAGLAVWTRKTLRAWREDYDAWPAVEESAFDEANLPLSQEDDAAEATREAPPPRRDVDAMELRRALRTAWEPAEPAGAFAALGPVEKVVAKAFSPRQRRQLVLYGPPPSRTHRTLAKALGIAGAAVAAWLVFGSRGFGVGGAIAAFVWLLPFWSGRWVVLNGVPQGVAVSPLHAFLPVSLWSLAGAYCTVGFARILVATALFAGALWPILGGSAALHHASLGGVLATACLPCALIVAISDCTNDSSARPWRTLLVIPIGGLWLIWEVGLAVTMFMAESSGTRAVCAGMLVATNFGTLAVYLKAVGSRWFDLVRFALR